MSPVPPDDDERSDDPVDLLDFTVADQQAEELEGLSRHEAARRQKARKARARQPARRRSADLLDFTRTDQEALDRGGAEGTLELKLGATWLQAGALGVLSFSFVMLGLFPLPGVEARFQGSFLLAGAAVLLLGGERIYRYDRETFYPKGLTFGGLKLAYGGFWALHFHLDLIKASELLMAWSLLFLIHALLSRRYHSQVLFVSALLMAMVGLGLGFDQNYLGTQPYGVALMVMAGLACLLAVRLRQDTALLGCTALGLLWFGLLLGGAKALAGVPLGELDQTTALTGGMLMLGLSLALQVFRATRPVTLGELHRALPDRYRPYGAGVALVGGAALALALFVGNENHPVLTGELARTGVAALVMWSVYGLLAGYLPLEEREPSWARWAGGGMMGLLLWLGITQEGALDLTRLALSLALAGSGLLVVRQLKRISEMLLLGGWVLATLGLTMAAMLGWIEAAVLGVGLVVLHLVFALLLWRREATTLALLLAPMLVVWATLYHYLLGGSGQEGWPAHLVASYGVGVGLLQARRWPHRRPFTELLEGGSESTDWIRAQKWLHLFNLSLGAGLLAGAVSAAHSPTAWRAVPLVLPLAGFTLVHLVNGGAWGRLGLPAAWLVLAGPAAFVLQIPLVLQLAGLGLASVLMVVRHHHLDWAVMLLVFAAVGAGAFCGSLDLEQVDGDLRWLPVGIGLALLTAVFPRLRENWVVSGAVLLSLLMSFGAAPGFPAAYGVSFGTLLLWILYTHDPPVKQGRFRLMVTPVLALLTTIWLLIFGYLEELPWETVWVLHFMGLGLVWKEALRKGYEVRHNPWVIMALLLPLAPSIVTMGEPHPGFRGVDFGGYLGLFSLGLTFLAVSSRVRRPLAWMVPWGAFTLMILHFFALGTNPPRELLEWELTRDMGVVTMLTLLWLGTTGPNHHQYRWYETVATALMLLLASSFDLQVKGDHAGLVLAILLVGPAVFCLAILHRDVFSAPVGYICALVVGYYGLRRLEDEQVAAVGLVLGMLLLLVLAVAWQQWGPGEPMTFTFSFAALVLLLPSYFYLEALEGEDHLLAANLAYASAGNLALIGGFLQDRRYLRLGAGFFLLSSLILDLWAVGSQGLDKGLFALSLAYWALVLLLISRAYWGRQRREAGKL